MNPSAIKVDHLRVGYGRRMVLDDVSLEVPVGQTFALLGRNGAGKTTLIRTLLGLLAPASGGAEVAWLNPTLRPLDVRRSIGYLAEDQAMYGWMTANQIAAFLAPFYPTWDARLVRDLFTRFGVPTDVRIKHLSKGQNVRLGLALALAHRPGLVILDDPAMGLDPITRKQFNRDVVEHLQSEGRTVFYSSHLLYEVEAVADAVAILDQGRLLRVGTTEALQNEVKRVVASPAALAGREKPAKLLDVTRRRDQLAVTLDDAGPWIRKLEAGGIEHAVEDLSLDEIFEAFVIGQSDAWPGQAANHQAVVA
ncbi:MAG TPA: ABC transporter ATP-binding protein [Pirellulales bacterium]|jgi:ABC-2 type transport system ATP-binding protein|nr:ABC transporter ATP-binding protein [Pirellulales bacterium]